MVKKHKKKKRKDYLTGLRTYETWFGSVTVPVIFCKRTRRTWVDEKNCDPTVLKVLKACQ